MIIGSGDRDYAGGGGFGTFPLTILAEGSVDLLPRSKGRDAWRESVDTEDSEVLRLKLSHQLPQRAIGQSLRLSKGAISDYLGLGATSRSEVAVAGGPGVSASMGFR